MHELIACADPSDAARRAAQAVTRLLIDAVRARGKASLAVSGGTTAAALFDELVEESVPWQDVQIFQVDERVAPDGDPERNLVTLTEHPAGPAKIPVGNVHAMPVSSLPPGAAAKADVVPRLLAGDPSIPAGRVRPCGSSTVFVDRAAAGNVR